MASRAVNYWRSLASRFGATRSMATATSPKTQAYAARASDFVREPDNFIPKRTKADFTEVYVPLGLIVVSLTFGLLTAKQHVLYDPTVRVHKKRRETIPEVVEPDRVLNEADLYVNRSLFRRVAHVRDFDDVRAGISHPTRGRTIEQPRKVETLKEVGVKLENI